MIKPHQYVEPRRHLLPNLFALPLDCPDIPVEELQNVGLPRLPNRPSRTVEEGLELDKVHAQALAQRSRESRLT